MSTKPNLPFSTRRTAISAGLPTDRFPSSSCLISFAGFHVDHNTTDGSAMPSASTLSMTFSMSFMPAFMLPMCRSVEMESGTKPDLNQRNRDAPQEAAAAMAQVEDDTALTPLDHPLAGLAVRPLLATQARVHVRVNVARAEDLREQIV